MLQRAVFEVLKNTTGTDALPLEYKVKTTEIYSLVIVTNYSPTIW